jgi:hypothetical protein
MASLEALAAVLAVSDLDIEASVEGLLGDLDLELLGGVVVADPPAADTRIGESDGDDLVDPFGDRSKGSRPVVRTWLTTPRPGMLSGRSLGEGSGLTPLSTKGFGQFLFELGDAGDEFGDAGHRSAQFRVLSEESRVLPTQGLQLGSLGIFGRHGKTSAPLSKSSTRLAGGKTRATSADTITRPIASDSSDEGYEAFDVFDPEWDFLAGTPAK